MPTRSLVCALALMLLLCVHATARAATSHPQTTAAEKAPQLVALRGRVVDVEGAPVEGARVELLVRGDIDRAERTATTDAEGRYEIEVPPGGGLLAFVAEGHARVRLQFRDGATVADTVTLPAGTTITGRLRTPDGDPVIGARVQAVDMIPTDGMIWVAVRAWSDDQGIFHLRHAPTSQVELEITAEGFCPVRMLEIDRTKPLTLTLDRAVELSGVVVDADGSPAGASSVSATGENGRSLWQRTDDGTFRLWAEPGVRYRISARASDSKVFSEILVGPQRDLRLQLGAPTTAATAEILRITAANASTGETIEAFEVAAKTDRIDPGLLVFHGWPEHRTTTGGLDVPLAGLREPGRGRALVRAEGFADLCIALPDAVAADGDGPIVTRLAVEMHPERHITGTVVDSDGAPIAGAWAWAFPTATKVYGYSGRAVNAVRTDARGRYRIERLGATEHWVQAVADGSPVPDPEVVSTEDGDSTHDVRMAPTYPLTIDWTNPPETEDWIVRLFSSGTSGGTIPRHSHGVVAPASTDLREPLRIPACTLSAVSVEVERLSVGRVPFRQRATLGSVDLAETDRVTFDLAKLETGRIRGTVALAREFDVERLVVHASSGQAALVGRDGAFDLEVDPGNWELRVRDIVSGAELGKASTSVTRGGVREVAIDAQAGTVIVEVEPAEGRTHRIMARLFHRPAGADDIAGGIDLRGLRGPVRLLLPPDTHEIGFRHAAGTLERDGGHSFEIVGSQEVRVRAEETVRLTLREPALR